MLLFSIVAVGLAAVGIFSFSVLQFVGLFVALIIAAAVNQHQFTIPQTKIVLTAKEVIIFWGIIWLGVPGGIILAACVFAASYKNAPKDKIRWLLDGFINITSACVAGEIFYFLLKHLAGFTDNAVAENTIALGWVIAATIPMAFAQYLLSFALGTVFIKLKSASSATDEFDLPKENPVFSFRNLSISLASALTLHLIFLVFGWSFSFVILPLVLVGQLAYRLHVARLDQKTKEIMEASRVHLATVEALATAIDARDQVGIGHVRRTQIYAVGIGELLDLSDSDLHALNTGALLHDSTLR